MPINPIVPPLQLPESCVQQTVSTFKESEESSEEESEEEIWGKKKVDTENLNKELENMVEPQPSALSI